MATDVAFVFYGYSGGGLSRGLAADADLTKVDATADRDRSFFLAASTLARMIRNSFPGYDVRLRAAWNHELLLNALMDANGAIQQVQVVAHGGSSGISLAYRFVDHYQRLTLQANEFSMDTGQLGEAPAIARTLAREDGLISGRLTRYGDELELSGAPIVGPLVQARARIATILGQMAPKSYWHVWGCFAGNPFADYSVSPRAPEEVRHYRSELNRLLPGTLGISREIAKVFQTHCTAAIGDPGSAEGAGLLFFSRDQAGKFQAGSGQREPTWMWTKPGASWITYGPDSMKIDHVMMFQKLRSAADLPPARVTGPDPKKWRVATPPPSWLTDAYDRQTLR